MPWNCGGNGLRKSCRCSATFVGKSCGNCALEMSNPSSRLAAGNCLETSNRNAAEPVAISAMEGAFGSRSTIAGWMWYPTALDKICEPDGYRRSEFQPTWSSSRVEN